MRNSWNFSTAIFEIWVLVLTKPGWANETPMTSLTIPQEYSDFPHHHHQHSHHHHPHNHYSVDFRSTNKDFDSSDFLRNSKVHRNSYQHKHFHRQPHASSSFYSSSNNNHHYSSNKNYHNHETHRQQQSFDTSNSHSPAVASALSSSSSLYALYAAVASAPHRCYVCLPPNKNSKEAQQILAMFAKDIQSLIPYCSQFDPYVDARRFEFDCPSQEYDGCILRIHGNNVSRACSKKYRVNDCKKANSVEFCYCTTPLCNDKKPEIPIIPAVVHHHPQRSRTRNSKSSVLRSDGDHSPQGIRSRVSEDDEDTMNPSEDDDDDDSGGSGTGSDDDEQQSRNRQNSLIDPFTGTTMDPTIFQEENSFAVAVEDPNPHTKIGISMTASTSGVSSISSSNSHTHAVTSILGSSFWCYWCWSTRGSSSSNSFSDEGPLSQKGETSNSINHLFYRFLHQAVFVRLFDAAPQKTHHHPPKYTSFKVTDTSSSGTSNSTREIAIGSGSVNQPSHHYHYFYPGGSQVAPSQEQKQEAIVEGEVHKWESTSHSPPEATTSSFVYSPLWAVLSGQLCFIISLLLVLVQVLSS